MKHSNDQRHERNRPRAQQQCSGCLRAKLSPVAASLDKKRLDALLLTISVPAGRDQACEGLAQLAVDVNILGRKAESMHEIFLHCLLGTIFAVPECGCCMFVPAHDSEACPICGGLFGHPRSQSTLLGTTRNSQRVSAADRIGWCLFDIVGVREQRIAAKMSYRLVQKGSSCSGSALMPSSNNSHATSSPRGS
jgi:hypothetical protein